MMLVAQTQVRLEVPSGWSCVGGRGRKDSNERGVILLEVEGRPLGSFTDATEA